MAEPKEARKDNDPVNAFKRAQNSYSELKRWEEIRRKASEAGLAAEVKEANEMIAAERATIEENRAIFEAAPADVRKNLKWGEFKAADEKKGTAAPVTADVPKPELKLFDASSLETGKKSVTDQINDSVKKAGAAAPTTAERARKAAEALVKPTTPDGQRRVDELSKKFENDQHQLSAAEQATGLAPEETREELEKRAWEISNKKAADRAAAEEAQKVSKPEPAVAEPKQELLQRIEDASGDKEKQNKLAEDLAKQPQVAREEKRLVEEERVRKANETTVQPEQPMDTASAEYRSQKTEDVPASEPAKAPIPVAARPEMPAAPTQMPQEAILGNKLAVPPSAQPTGSGVVAPQEDVLPDVTTAKQPQVASVSKPITAGEGSAPPTPAPSAGGVEVVEGAVPGEQPLVGSGGGSNMEAGAGGLGQPRYGGVDDRNQPKPTKPKVEAAPVSPWNDLASARKNVAYELKRSGFDQGGIDYVMNSELLNDEGDLAALRENKSTVGEFVSNAKRHLRGIAIKRLYEEMEKGSKELDNIQNQMLDETDPDRAKALYANGVAEANRFYVNQRKFESLLVADAYDSLGMEENDGEVAKQVDAFDAERSAFLSESSTRLNTILGKIDTMDKESDPVTMSGWRIASKVLSALFVGIGSMGASLAKTPNYALEIFRQAEADERARQRSLLAESSQIRSQMTAAFGRGDRARTGEALARTRAARIAVDAAKNRAAPYGARLDAFNATSSAFAARQGILLAGFALGSNADANKMAKMRDDNILRATAENRQREALHIGVVKTNIDNAFRERKEQAKLDKDSRIPDSAVSAHAGVLGLIDSTEMLVPKYVAAVPKWSALDSYDKALFSSVSAGLSAEFGRVRSDQKLDDTLKDSIVMAAKAWLDKAIPLREKNPELFAFLAQSTLMGSKFIKERSGAAVSNEERAFLMSAVTMLADPPVVGIQKFGDFVKTALLEDFANLKSFQDAGRDVTKLYNSAIMARDSFGKVLRDNAKVLNVRDLDYKYSVPVDFEPTGGQFDDLKKSSEDAQRKRIPAPSGTNPLGVVAGPNKDPEEQKELSDEDVSKWWDNKRAGKSKPFSELSDSDKAKVLKAAQEAM